MLDNNRRTLIKRLRDTLGITTRTATTAVSHRMLTENIDWRRVTFVGVEQDANDPQTIVEVRDGDANDDYAVMFLYIPASKLARLPVPPRRGMTAAEITEYEAHCALCAAEDAAEEVLLAIELNGDSVGTTMPVRLAA